ncbi:MAG: hypothetical protein ACM3SR_04855 [Ignavibacteriales bacterium]
MIETFLVEDKIHYQKAQLEIMKRALMQNFILSENPDLEAMFKHTTPQIRIYIKFPMGLLPEILLRALGEDLCDSISGVFLNALSNPNSGETPSLVFHFVGDFRSLEFKVTSRDEKNLIEASEKVMEKLLNVIKSEELPSESNDTQTFHYENGDWTQAK